MMSAAAAAAAAPRRIKLGGETDSEIRRRKRTGVSSQRGRE